MTIKTLKIAAINFLFATTLSAQVYDGEVLCAVNKEPVDFANIGIIGRELGTVSDENGSFSLLIAGKFDSDSIRISKIGYQPVTLLVKDFKELQEYNIFLTPADYKIPEIQVTASKRKLKMFGEPIFSTNLYPTPITSELNHYALGIELGVIIDVNKKTAIRTVHLNVHECSFDTMYLRLKVYNVEGINEFRNILTKPVYISFTKEEVKESVVFDVSEHDIVVKGKILLAIELYKYLGEGEFVLKASYFTGYTFRKSASEGKWRAMSGRLGLYFYGERIK